MSIHHTSQVWEHSSAAGNTLLVLLALADNADRTTGIAWPSVGDLSRRSRISERTVQRCLRELEELGEVIVTQPGGGTGRSTRYKVVPKNGDKLTPLPEEVEGRQSDAVSGAQNPDTLDGVEGRQIDTDPGGGTVTNQVANGDNSVTRTIRNRQGEASATADASPSTGSKRATAPAEEQVDAERELADYKHLLPFVDPVFERLVRVAEAKPGSITPTRRSVARLLRRMPNKDFLPVADKFEHYYLDGRARSKPVKDVVATFRNWLFKEPGVSRKTPPPSGVGDERSEQDARRRALAADTRTRLEAADR